MERWSFRMCASSKLVLVVGTLAPFWIGSSSLSMNSSSYFEIGMDLRYSCWRGALFGNQGDSECGL